MIYLLEPIVDDPRFEGFDGPIDVFRSTPDGTRTSPKLEIKRLSAGWNAPKVRGAVRPVNHYPCINNYPGRPVFSSYAIKYLREILQPNGEILPIEAPQGEYYYYNTTTVADILDQEHSEITWLKKPIVALKIRHYEFKTDTVDRLRIFRIPEKPASIFVTEPFVDAAFRFGLSGMRFAKVWPVPHGEAGTIKQVPVANRQRSKSIEPLALRDAKAQSVYLLLFKAGSSAEEVSSQVQVFENGLRKLLLPADPNEFGIGHLEFIDECDDHFKFILSCPKFETLAVALRDWPVTLVNRSRIRIIGRLGAYDNCESAEVDMTGTETNR